jgi:two-component system sensor histidine kinase KdpD
LSGGPEGDTLIRRGKRTASRGAGGELLAVHVERDDALASASSRLPARQRALVEELGGSCRIITANDTAQAILDFAREVNASQIVIGATRRSRPKRLFSRGIGETLIEGSGDDIDVYVVTHSEAARGRLLHRRTDVPESPENRP